MTREWPTSVVSPSGSWAMETFMMLDREEFITQGGQQAGLAVVDMSEYNNTGVVEFYAGIRMDGDGVFRVGWESSVNAFNNWYSTRGRTAAFIRLERDAAFNPAIYRAYYKYRSADNWVKMPVTIGENILRNGGIPSASLRPALVGRNWNGGTRFVSMYSYIRIGPLTCGDPGTVRLVNSLTTSAVVYGLASASTYRFAVWAASAAGYGAASAPSVALTTATVSPPAIGATVLVSQGKPCTSSSIYDQWSTCRQAVDGSLWTNLFHTWTDFPDGEWITIDLQYSTAVKTIAIYNRNDCCVERIREFSLYVGDNPDTNFIANAKCDPAIVPTAVENTATVATPLGNTNRYASIPCQLTGRYVTMQVRPNLGYFPFDGWLNLREIQVFAGNSCPNRGATGATQVMGTRCSAAGWGAVCTYQCLPGYVQVGGTTSSACNGEAWDAPELICAPACPDLPGPQYQSTCSQTFYAEDFSNVNGTALAKLITLEAATQLIGFPVTSPPIGSKWFNLDGVLQAAARYGCNSDLHLVIASQKIRNYPSSFTLTARVNTQDRAGLVWRAQDKQNMYRLYIDVTTNIHVVEKLVAGNPLRITDFSYPLLADTWYTVAVTMFNADMNITINGIPMTSTSDRQFLVGYAGVYAQTVGFFDDISFAAACSGLAIGATDKDIATFGCAPGLIALGPTSRTCVQTGSTPAWSPDPSTVPLACTLPPPTFVPSTLLIRENSGKNTVVGDPLVAYSASPDYQIQFQITAGNDAGIFWVDACSGQVKLRIGGPGVLDFELRNTYVLTVRAFVPNFVACETFRNITISVLNLDEPPIVVPNTVFLTENAAVLSSGTFVWNNNVEALVGAVQWWDPENSTVSFTLTVDGAVGAFTVNSTTGEVRVAPGEGTNASSPVAAPLSFERTSSNLVLQVSAAQNNDTTMVSTGSFSVTLVDANDPPYITRGQSLTIQDTDTVSASAGIIVALDEDVGSFAAPLSYVQVFGADAVAACSVQSGSHPSVDETVAVTPSTNLFTVNPTTGEVTLARITTTARPAAGWRNWDEDFVFVTSGKLARSRYVLCVNVSDGMGGVDIQPVEVVIQANVPGKPQVNQVLGAVQMSTVGNELVVFNGSGFFPSGYNFANQPPLSVWYSNGEYSYNSSCVVETETAISCTTQPGIGADHLWTIILRYKPVVSPIPLRTTYMPPAIMSVSDNAGLPTQGLTNVWLNGTNLGPPGTVITVKYGRNYEYTCTQRSVTSHFAVNCTSAPGTGASLPFTITVGGQTATYTSSFPFSYGLPVITSIQPVSGSTFTLGALDSAGGQTVVITGANFGPAGTLTNPSYGISLSYGGSSGTMLAFSNCQQSGGANAHTNITCDTVPGVGISHKVFLIVDSQALVGPYPESNATSQLLSYMPPVITRMYGPGSKNADTSGGQLVYIEGQHFGPIVFPITTINSVVYGRQGDINRYQGQSCRVISAPPQISTISCATDEGIGRDHWWSIAVGGQSAPVYMANTSYAAPQIISFSDIGSVDADTVGNEVVRIQGRNLGPATTFTNSRLAVFYNVNLIDGGAFTNLSYVAAGCEVTTSHTEIRCLTLEGGGRDLNWEILLDGQLSTNPTTNYHEPRIDSITYVDGVTPVTAANVDGGDVVLLNGRFYGPPSFQGSNRPLVQRVSYGLSGAEYVVPPANWVALSDGQVRVTLLPGVGVGLRFRITVADQTSDASAGTFSFAIPEVVRLVPNTARTQGDENAPTAITMITRNFPVRDLTCRYSVTFGQGAYQLTLPPTVPSGADAIAARLNADGTLNTTFFLPVDFLGQGLGVKVSIFQGTSSAPIMVTNVTADTVFNYRPPYITDVVVTRALFYPADTNASAVPTNGDYVRCPFAVSDPTWSCTDPSIMQVFIIGDNFGADPGKSKFIDGVARSLDLLCRNYTAEGIPQLGEVWGTDCRDRLNSPVRLYLHAWDHRTIRAFSNIPIGTLRLTLFTPQTWDGKTDTIVLSRPFKNDAPAIGNLRGAFTGIPSAGSVDPIELDVENLGGSTELLVTVGGRPATVVLNDCRGGSQTAGQWIVADTTALRSALISCGTPPTWTIRILAPPGQGSSVPIVITRYTGAQAFSSNTNTKVSYAKPVITGVAVQLPPGGSSGFGAVVPVSITSNPTVVVPTDGSIRVRVVGTNLGTEPVIWTGDSMMVPTASIAPCWELGQNFTCWEFTSPAGEGDGFDVGGYKLYLIAGDNEQTSNKINTAYEVPVVTGFSAPDSFPTAGGVSVVFTGRNFGQYNPARGTSTVISVFFAQPGRDGPALACTDIQRLSHYAINCTLPEGSGSNLNVTVTVAGLRGGSAGPIFSYDMPIITRAYMVSDADFAENSTDLSTWTVPANASVVEPGVNSAALELGGPTVGGSWIILEGANFGTRDPAAHCVFMTWRYRPNVAGRNHTCNNGEDFLGEGEVPASSVTSIPGGWTHTRIVFRTSPGIGHKELELSIRGSTLSLPRFDSRLVRFTYDTPVIDTLDPVRGDTEGGDIITLTGRNFGPTMRNTVANPLSDGLWPAGLVSLEEATHLPMGYVSVVFHTFCIASAYDVVGRREPTATIIAARGKVRKLQDCSYLLDSGLRVEIISQDQTSIKFRTPSGVGAGKNVTVQIVDNPAVSDLQLTYTQISNPAVFSYRAPLITSFSRPYVAVNGDGTIEQLNVLGLYFGNYDLSGPTQQDWSDEEKALTALAGGLECVDISRSRRDGETVIGCGIDPTKFTVGSHNFTVVVAGQTGFNPARPFLRSLKIVCNYGSYARANETCRPCPANFPSDPTKNGATCRGYVPSIENILGFEASLTYPVPNKGWYNLNSSDMHTKRWQPDASMMDACPEGFQDGGRDVCVVPCDPPESCLGDNFCAFGYTSKPPMWRCSSCDTGFYKRAGECIKCPDSPAALFIGFIILIVAAGGVGFMLNKRQVNIAVISIGIDFFQVLAIFSQSRIKWPPIVKELLHVLSAFNLNIEIVAPECLIPDVSYKQKFWFIMLLPVSVGGLLLGGLFTSLALWKIIKGMPKKKWFSHKPTLISSTLILFYMLYLYLTRTVFDVFNCSPTQPPDGYTYLSVVFERCGVPGGTQVTLLPFAVAGLIVYTGGYPLFIGYTLYKNRELVMEDQLLRAKGTGVDRLTNPHAYEFRKQYGRSYFQFKPDWCLWILAIIFRKFLIAITAVVFNKNASFQMAACLLIMFLAYSLQMMTRPYMSPGEYDDVLKAHAEASYTSAVHARLRAIIANIETRGRKKARKNLINFEGKLDRAAILGVLSGVLFNYNTVEQIMLFAAVIVCLMGIMYQANELSTYYPESKDSVTAVVLIVIIVAIIYFFTVLVTEIVVLYNEENRAKQLARSARANKVGGSKGRASSEDAKAGSSSKGKLVGDDGDINTGKLDTQMNPLFMNKDGALNSSDAVGVDSIMQQRVPPPPELWVVFQQGYVDMHRQLQAANEQLVESKRAAQMAEMTGGGGGGSGGAVEEQDMAVSLLGSKKKSFAPKGTGAGSKASALSSFKSNGAGGESLSSLRSARRTTAAASPSTP